MLNDIQFHGIGVGKKDTGEVVKVTASSEEPSNPEINDIWIYIEKEISNIFFQQSEPQGLQNGDVWFRVIHLLTELNIDVKGSFVQRGVSLKGNEVLIYKSDILKVYTELGNARVWDNEWLFSRASYWSGSEWVTFSRLEFDFYVTNSFNIHYLNHETEILNTESRGGHGFEHTYHPDGNLFTVDLNRVCKWSKDLSEMIWEFNVGSGNVLHSIAVDKHGYTYATGRDTNQLRKISPEGDVVWSRTLRTNSRCVTTDDQGHVYVASNRVTTSNDSSFIYKVDTETDEIIWSVQVPANAISLSLDLLGNLFFSGGGGSGSIMIAKISTDDGSVMEEVAPIANSRLKVNPHNNFYAVNSNGVYLYDNDLNLLWESDTQGSSAALDIDPESCLYFRKGSSASTILKTDENGEVLWEKEFENNVHHVTIQLGEMATFPHLY